MTALRWTAEGIEAAQAAGGVTLEPYHRPGFTGGPAIRRLSSSLAGGQGFELVADPDPYEDDE